MFDAFPLVWWKLKETFSDEMHVEKGDRKEADATVRATRAAGDLTQEGGIGTRKPVIGFSRQGQVEGR